MTQTFTILITATIPHELWHVTIAPGGTESDGHSNTLYTDQSMMSELWRGLNSVELTEPGDVDKNMANVVCTYPAGTKHDYITATEYHN